MAISGVDVEFAGKGLSKYGLFGLLLWFMQDILELEDLFRCVTVKRKRSRNPKKEIKRRKSAFPTPKMCLMILTLILAGISRFERMTNLLKDETRLAEMIGVPRFCDPSTIRTFLQQFDLWHLKQLDRVNTTILEAWAESFCQDVPIVDFDASTHSMESKKREKANRGYNKKNRGKPCYQWSIAFVRGEAVSQVLDEGNTHCSQHLMPLLTDIGKKLNFNPSQALLRLDGGYSSAEMLETIYNRDLQFVGTFPYKTILNTNGIKQHDWVPLEKDKRIFDLGNALIYKKSPYRLRVILLEVKKKSSKSKKQKTLRYAIGARLLVPMSAASLYHFYHGRQTIENFFKEAKHPFNAGKMPCQRFRANQAYLYFVVIAYNVFRIFKKNTCHQNGVKSLLQRFEIK